ncbi:MAG: hypothetical protein NTV72_00405 [Candidatus Taylorbacteria bacterium]|nr:hypothetical protein [Candidatus Taylorbacteria bacterium]
MAYFKKQGGFSGGDRDFRPTEKFKATCAECHKPCEVPFRPTGGKPVYCRNCFSKNKPEGSSDFGRKDFRDDRRSAPRFAEKRFSPARPDFRDNRQPSESNDTKRLLETVIVKLDKLIEVCQKMK